MTAYQHYKYLLMATDPVHVGTGGYRLGRVDNSIVREPGTRIPKIPGSSLHGAARSYAARLYENLDAAGQSQAKVTNPDKDPVCYTFGYLKTTAPQGTTQTASGAGSATGQQTVAYSGVVNVFDAQVLLFPIHSMAGPVWVSTVARLTDAGCTLGNLPATWTANQALYSWARNDAINLGWFMLTRGGEVTVGAPTAWASAPRWQAIAGRIVLVQESIFSHVVNSNLEVRTSVSINPERGAAEDKALFTYEALPRGTFLSMDVVLDDYRAGGSASPFPVAMTAKGNALPGSGWTDVVAVFDAGLGLVEWLGVGGMGTRGFGRVAVVAHTP